MNKLEIYKKKIIYKSLYRGTKECDILIKKLISEYIDSFSEIELTILDDFLDIEDDKIMQSIFNKSDETYLKYKFIFDKLI